MKTFFTSDTHFGHANIIRYSNRPWLEPGDLNEGGDWISRDIARHRCRQMDGDLIRAWNNTVSNDDIVYHLGDFNFGSATQALDLLMTLNFKEFNFVWGNHDDAMRQAEFILEGRNDDLFSSVNFIGDMPEIVVNDQKIVLTHYAMRVWNGSHKGVWNLYGHSHGSLPEDPHSLSFDVGVDCTKYVPISFEEVKERMSKKFYKPVDHHGQKLNKADYEKAERKRLYEQLKKEFES